MRPAPLVAIDPGLNSMGVAYWRSPKKEVPEKAFLLKAPRKLDLTPRALWLARELEQQLNLSGGREHDFVCEYPAWHGSARGWATGDLQKLVFLVGVMAGYFQAARSFTPVTPHGWKGQLGKDVVIRRLQKRFGPGATMWWEKDCWDAVGIGLWKMGRF
jgi:hypothetical protein